MSASYEYYKIFYYVAKYRSLNKAAAVLLNSQPNIARAINNLEAELGVTLFTRSHKGVSLTPEGEELYKYVKVAHRQFQLGEAALEAARNLKHGNVSIGFSIGITAYQLIELILPSLRAFHKEYPDVHIQVHNDTTPNLRNEVSEGLIDMAVVTAIPEKKERNETVLSTYSDIIIAGPAYGAMRREGLSLSDIVKCPVISIVHGSETYDLYNHFFSSNGLPFEPAIEATTTSQVIAFVQADMGIGAISPEYAREAIEAGKVLKLDIAEKMPLRTISLVCGEGISKTSAANELMQMILHQNRKV